MELEKWLAALSEADEESPVWRYKPPVSGAGKSNPEIRAGAPYAAEKASSSSDKMSLIKNIGAELSDEAKKLGFEVLELNKDGEKPNSWAIKFADGTMEKGNFLDIVQKCIEIASNPSVLRKHGKKAEPKTNRLGEYE